MAEHPRRRFLQLCGAAATSSLAGCYTGDGSTKTATDTRTATDRTTDTPTATNTATDTPSSTDTSADTATETESPTQEPATLEVWTVDRLSGRVDTIILPDAGPTDDPTGPLYAATEAGEVARIEPVEGRHEWTTTVRGEEAGDPALDPIGDAVYAVSETFTDERLANHVEALDPATGAVRWTYEDRAFLRVLGVVEDLVVLAGEYIDVHPEEIGPNRSPRGDGRIYALDRATGDECWVVDVPKLRGADVASHGVYALETRDYETNLLTLHAVDLDGDERWSVDTETINPGAPLAADDLLLAGAASGDDTESGAVGRYDPADGSLLWTAGEWDRGPSELSLEDSTIHAGSWPFVALDPDGNERFRVQQFSVSDAPATPETLYSDGGSQISAVDREAGEIRWRYRPEDYEYTHLRAVLADYVAVDRGIGEDREIVLVDETDGTVAGIFETPGFYWGTVGAGRHLFAGVESDIVAYDVGADLG